MLFSSALLVLLIEDRLTARSSYAPNLLQACIHSAEWKNYERIIKANTRFTTSNASKAYHDIKTTQEGPGRLTLTSTCPLMGPGLLSCRHCQSVGTQERDCCLGPSHSLPAPSACLYSSCRGSADRAFGLQLCAAFARQGRVQGSHCEGFGNRRSIPWSRNCCPVWKVSHYIFVQCLDTVQTVHLMAQASSPTATKVRQYHIFAFLKVCRERHVPPS